MGFSFAWQYYWYSLRSSNPFLIALAAAGCAEGFTINPSPKKVTICASEAKPKQRGEAPVCTRNTIAKGKGDEED